MVLAAARDITGDLDVEVQLAIWVGWSVAEDGDVGHAGWSLANTKVDWSPVAHVRAGLVPPASILNWRSGWVDVVLGGGKGVAPLVVLVGIWAGHLVLLAWLGVQWNSLRLGTWVVGAADWNIAVKLVLDANLTSATNAENIVVWVGELKLAL